MTRVSPAGEGEWPGPVPAGSGTDGTRTRGGLAIDVSADARSATASPPAATAAERAVADQLPIGAPAEAARAAVDRVPLWFHTFSLDGEIYTPGVARDHRYRLPFLPDELIGRTVLDVGTFDGFYAFLAEARGARRVVAVDNEQYKHWVRARWGVELEGGEGFRTVAALLDSKVAYRRIDAFALDELGERFDLILCFGILHRVDNPLGLLSVLRRRLEPAGELLLETYGVDDPSLNANAAMHVCEPGEVYARDDYVYWGFTGASLDRLARHAGFAGATVLDAPMIDGHPRIICRLDAGGPAP
jgi:tRNA (mo5U34)-methyltransferase